MSSYADPEKHFGFPCCSSCAGKPCRRLGPDGGLYGSIRVLSAEQWIPRSCPFLIGSEHDLRTLLGSCNDWSLDQCREGALRGRWRTDGHGTVHYVTGPDRRAEFVSLVVAQWRRGACIAIGLRPGWRSDPRLRRFFARSELPDWLIDRVRKHTEPEENAALGADCAPADTGPLTITNLRWEHTSDRRREDSPTRAAESDTVRLLADVENYVEGAGVDFFVWDTAPPSRKLLAKIHTRCKNRAAEVTWAVDLSRASDEPKVAFECEARSKLSERGAIDIIAPFVIWLQVDLDDPLTDDDTLILEATDGSYRHVARMKEQTEQSEDYVGVAFPMPDKSKIYDLIYDPGKEGEPHVIADDVDYAYLMNETQPEERASQ